MKIYKVGGCVRDAIIGVKSKDIDYSCEVESFDAMRVAIIAMGGTIFVEKPEFLTIRARVGRETFDYVMCRKDGVYSDGRRPETVEPGTILDDLSRRDFTMNAIAQITTGELYDPFNGYEDIQKKLIRCVGDTDSRFSEDYLRLMRAARFMITKGFSVSPEIESAFDDEKYINGLKNVSVERIREEVEKMFRADTMQTINFFAIHPKLAEAVFSRGLWIKPTLESR